MQLNKFNLRVYGILINNKNNVLVCDEFIKGKIITKFPGGGLEFGEGTIDCLKREFIEETGTPIEVIKHFYTTDFFVLSAYNPSHQIISIYYLVKSMGDLQVPVESHSHVNLSNENPISFRWVSLENINPDIFTLPIDKHVVGLLSGQ